MMLCDELKTETIVPQGCTLTLQMYPKGEVDAAIAELKAENERLVKCCEEYDSRQRIDENIKFNGVKQLRATKRAMWLARAERAAAWQIHFSVCHNHSIDREFYINGASMPCEGMVTMRTARDWAMIWKKVDHLCRQKVEEYK